MKSYYTAPLKNGAHFFWYESFSKGYNVLNEFRFQSHMRFCLTQLSATRFYGSPSVYSRPLPSEKKSPFAAQQIFIFIRIVKVWNYLP